MQDRHRVLVVDDEAALRSIYVRMLSEAGFEVEAADNPSRADDLALARRPALALVDLLYGGVDMGFDLCQALSGRGVPVFAMTGALKREEDRLRAFENGAVQFWEKPGSPRPVVEDIKWFLSQKEPLLQLRNAARDRLGAPAVAAPVSLGRVLVVDDEQEMGEATCATLEQHGFVPFYEPSGRRALAAALKLDASAIVLDLGLGDIDGLQVLRFIRAHPKARGIPVLIWTGSQQKGLEVVCLSDGGADDYAIKGVNDVAAIPQRVERLLGRAAREPKVIEKGPVRVDRGARSVLVHGKPISGLAAKEFELLLYLLDRSPAVVSWTDLQRELWHIPEDRLTARELPTIAVQLDRLKKKLGRAVEGCFIVHRGLGLQFDPSRAR